MWYENAGIKEFRGETNCQQALDRFRKHWRCPECGSSECIVHFVEHKTCRIDFADQDYAESEVEREVMHLHKVQCNQCRVSFNGVEAYDQTLRR